MKAFRLFAALALAAFCTTAAAQSVVPGLQQAESVTYVGTLNPFSGLITPATSGAVDAPQLCYDNTASNGSLFTPGLNKENLCWGTFTNCSGVNLVNQIDLAYATKQTNSALVKLTLRIYTGSTGFCNKGTLLATYALTNLPASTSATQFQGFVIGLDLTGAEITLPNGPIGWSYEFFDATLSGPLLSGPPFGPGTANAFDQYQLPAGNCLGTFFFGNPPSPNASSYIGFYTEPPASPCGLAKYGEVVVPVGINKGVMEISAGATGKLGTNFDLIQSIPQNGIGVKGYVYAALAKANIYDPGFDGTILIDAGSIVLVLGPKTFPGLNPTVSHTVSIPNDVSLVGAEVDFQGLYISTNVNAPLRFTNGVELIICP